MIVPPCVPQVKAMLLNPMQNQGGSNCHGFIGLERQLLICARGDTTLADIFLGRVCEE